MADAAGHHALVAQDYATACRHFESSLAVFRTDGNQLYLISSLLGLALASDADGNRTRSEVCWQEILALTEARGKSVYRGWALWGLGLGAWQRGEHSRAEDLVTQGLHRARSVDDCVSAGVCMEVLCGSRWMGELPGAPPG